MDLDEKATVRFETMPGKQGQMDWGFFEEHTVYEDGKWKKLYCFLLVLGYLRMRYIEFVTDMSTNTLISQRTGSGLVQQGQRESPCHHQVDPF